MLEDIIKLHWMGIERLDGTSPLVCFDGDGGGGGGADGGSSIEAAVADDPAAASGTAGSAGSDTGSGEEGQGDTDSGLEGQDSNQGQGGDPESDYGFGGVSPGAPGAPGPADDPDDPMDAMAQAQGQAPGFGFGAPGAPGFGSPGVTGFGFGQLGQQGQSGQSEDDPTGLGAMGPFGQTGTFGAFDPIANDMPSGQYEAVSDPPGGWGAPGPGSAQDPGAGVAGISAAAEAPAGGGGAGPSGGSSGGGGGGISDAGGGGTGSSGGTGSGIAGTGGPGGQAGEGTGPGGTGDTGGGTGGGGAGGMGGGGVGPGRDSIVDALIGLLGVGRAAAAGRSRGPRGEPVEDPFGTQDPTKDQGRPTTGPVNPVFDPSQPQGRGPFSAPVGQVTRGGPLGPATGGVGPPGRGFDQRFSDAFSPAGRGGGVGTTPDWGQIEAGNPFDTGRGTAPPAPVAPPPAPRNLTQGIPGLFGSGRGGGRGLGAPPVDPFEPPSQGLTPYGAPPGAVPGFTGPSPLAAPGVTDLVFDPTPEAQRGGLTPGPAPPPDFGPPDPSLPQGTPPAPAAPPAPVAPPPPVAMPPPSRGAPPARGIGGRGATPTGRGAPGRGTPLLDTQALRDAITMAVLAGQRRREYGYPDY